MGTKKQNKNFAIEIALSDGCVSMIVGELQSRNSSRMLVKKASFIKDTGRRSEFFAGRMDASVEIEPYPDDMELDLPAKGAVLYAWPHPLPRERR